MNTKVFEDLIWLFTSSYRNRGLIRLDLDEAVYIYKLVKQRDGEMYAPFCVDIGRLFGGSTILMAAAGGVVLSIDNLTAKSIKGSDKYDIKLKKTIKDMGLEDSVIIEVGDSSTYDVQYFNNKLSAIRKVDILLIDGDHSYEGVKKDYEHWLPVVNIGGSILFHDSCSTREETTPRPEVEKFVRELTLKKVMEVGSLTHFVKGEVR